MFRRFASIVIALVLAASMSGSVLGKTMPSPSIALDGSATLGATVTFVVNNVPNKVKTPRVEVLCYQPVDPSGYALYDPARGYLVYGETGSLAQAVGDGTDLLGYSGFLLGGGMSAWLLNGGPAECVANLFYFDNSGRIQTFNVLASTAFAAY